MKKKLLLFAAILLFVLSPIAYFGWLKSDQVLRFFEVQAPKVRIKADEIRGIGLAPVQFEALIADYGAGLDEIVLRTIQGQKTQEILRQKAEGRSSARISYEINGENAKLREGVVTLEIKAFDRSFWSNVTTETITLPVDYRRPEVEVLTTQHNARAGGTQLIAYKTEDRNLALSGIKVGNRQIFHGFPASDFDSSFTDERVMIGFYSVPIPLASTDYKLKVFASDKVGNEESKEFFNRIRSYQPKTRALDINQEGRKGIFEKLATRHTQQIDTFIMNSGEQVDVPSSSTKRSHRDAQLVNQQLYKFDNQQLDTLLTPKDNFRKKRLWKDAFKKQPGAAKAYFGETLEFIDNDQTIASRKLLGYILKSKNGSGIEAANDGFVLFADELGTYGKMIIIDHGQGITSIYAWLQALAVIEGARVQMGDVIGAVGKSGFGNGDEFLFEMRLQGTPVDPIEWWDKRWVKEHVFDKIDEVKKGLGMRKVVPLR